MIFQYCAPHKLSQVQAEIGQNDQLMHFIEGGGGYEDCEIVTTEVETKEVLNEQWERVKR